jgi:hypothetical protein
MLERTLFWGKSAMGRPHVVAQFMFRIVPTVALITGDSGDLWLGHVNLPPKIFARSVLKLFTAYPQLGKKENTGIPVENPERSIVL